ncbi:UbiA family prenyltransferase [Streptomyces zhihengii]
MSALFSVPGDALAGAAAVGARPGRGTALAVGASLCLYEAGMALNDWADREEDAAERPHRPVPSGRIAPRHALVAAGVLTAAGLTLAARAGRPPWRSPPHSPRRSGPTTSASSTPPPAPRPWPPPAHSTSSSAPRQRCLPRAARDAPAAGRGSRLPRRRPRGPGVSRHVLRPPTGSRGPRRGRTHGPRPQPGAAPASAAAPAEGLLRALREALPAAGVLGVHTYAVTAVSRHEVHGGSTRAPLAALAAAAAVAGFAARHRDGPGGPEAGRVAGALLAAAYARTAARPFLHAALNPSPQLTQRAVGGGIRAMIPLQAALAARSGAATTGLAVMGLVPLARRLARKVSPT